MTEKCWAEHRDRRVFNSRSGSEPTNKKLSNIIKTDQTQYVESEKTKQKKLK